MKKARKTTRYDYTIMQIYGRMKFETLHLDYRK